MSRRVAYKFIALDSYSAVADKINRKTVKIRKSMASLGKTVESTGKSIKKLGKNAQKMSIGASIAVGASAKAFGDLEKGVTNVLTLLNEEQLKKYSGRINQLAREAISMGFSIDDTTQALFNNVSALGANEQSFRAFQVAQKLAIGGVTDLAVAVSGIGAIMNAYGVETTDAKAVADSFFASQKKGTTDVNRLAINVGKVAPVAKNLGISYQELMATMAQLTQGGINTEESTTALRSVLNALENPGKQARTVLAALGVPMGTTQVRAAGLTGTLSKLAAVAEKHPDLLGQAIPNVRALLAAAALDEKALKRIQETIKDQTGLDAATAKQMRTFNQAMAQAKGATVLLFAGIGRELAPAITMIARGIVTLAKGFDNLSAGAKKMIAWATVFVAGLSSILSIVGTALIFAGKGAAIIAATAAGWALAIGVLLAALTALGVWIYKNWDRITSLLSKGFEKAKQFFGFGGGTAPDIAANAAAEINNRSQVDIDVGINAPKGVVSDVKTKATGTVPGLNVATNMAGAQ